MKEVWLPVPGYGGLYEVSSKGRARSVPRCVQRRHPDGRCFEVQRKGRLLKGYTDDEGYVQVRFSKDGTTKTFRLSRVVLHAFTGDAGESLEAGHKNHRRADNRRCNLEWVTRLENEQQKDAAARRPQVPWAKLTPKKAAEIRALRAQGYTYQAIATRYACHLSTVALICAGKIWV